jgi:hypothetical protein
MAGRKDAFDAPPVCERCGDVIGVYEPMIRVVDGSVVKTSRAAEVSKGGRGASYHLACYGHAGSPAAT